MYCLRRSKRWLGLWLIAAVLGHFGLSHEDPSAFVLCFGVDGHVAVEPAGHDHRVQAAHASKGGKQRAGAYTLERGKGPCVDISVVSEDHGAHKPLRGSHESSLDLPLAARVLTSVPIDERIAAAVLRSGPPMVDPGLRSLRSVILLI